jgi:hypothetical protein
MSTPEPITIASPMFRSALHLRHVPTNTPVVVDGLTWSLALHLATAEGWAMAGTRFQRPEVEPERRFGYLMAHGQLLEEADASALATALETAVDKYPTMTDAERDAVAFIPRRHPAQHLTDATPWLKVSPGLRAEPVHPYATLRELLGSEDRGLEYEGTKTIAGLRELVARLRQGGEFEILPDAPSTWIHPEEDTVLVRVLPRRHDQPPGVELQGACRTGGDCFRMKRLDAEAAKAAGIVEFMIDPETPEEPPAPSTFTPGPPPGLLAGTTFGRMLARARGQ